MGRKSLKNKARRLVALLVILQIVLMPVATLAGDSTADAPKVEQSSQNDAPKTSDAPKTESTTTEAPESDSPDSNEVTDSEPVSDDSKPQGDSDSKTGSIPVFKIEFSPEGESDLSGSAESASEEQPEPAGEQVSNEEAVSFGESAQEDEPAAEEDPAIEKEDSALVAEEPATVEEQAPEDEADTSDEVSSSENSSEEKQDISVEEPNTADPAAEAELEEPVGEVEDNQPAESGNSYVTELTEGSVVVGTGAEHEFTLTFSEVGSQTLGSARFDFTGSSFTDYSLVGDTGSGVDLTDNQGRDWYAEIFASYISITASDSNAYLAAGDSVSVVFKATTPGDAGIYQLGTTQAWTDNTGADNGSNKNNPASYYNEDVSVWVAGNEHTVSSSNNIQTSINSASDYDLIKVEVGTYNETLTIDKPLYIQSNPGAVLEGSGSGNGILIKSADTTIDGFEITNYHIGIRTYGGPENYNSLNILNNNIHDNIQNGILITHDSFNNVNIINTILSNNSQNAVGIADGAKISKLNIGGSNIYNNGHHGLYIVGAGTEISNMSVANTDILYNNFSGITVASGSYLSNAIFNNVEIAGSDVNFTVSGSGTTLNNLTMVNSSLSDSPTNHGFWLRESTINGLLFENVWLENNFNQGFFVSNGATLTDATISGGYLQNNKWGLLTQGSIINNLVVSGTQITGNTFGSGLSVASGTVNGLTVENCNFQNNAWEHLDIGVGWKGAVTVSDVSITGNYFGAGTGIHFADNAVFEESSIGIHYNSFVGGVPAIWNANANTVNASCNWWGTTDPTSVVMSGPVDFTPMLASGIDTDPTAPGFQPDLSTLIVHTLGEQVGTIGRIQEGVNKVNDGGTVDVTTGEYAGAIVTKAVSIIGADDNSSIITSGVHAREGLAIEAAFSLREGADGTEIKNFTVENNPSGNFYFAVFSRGVDNVVIDNLNIYDTVQGITNWGGSNWEITNNKIFETYAASGGGIGIYIGATSRAPGFPVASNNIISGNILHGTATATDFSCPAIVVGLDLRYGGYELLTGNELVSNNQITNNQILNAGYENSVGIEVGITGLEEDPDKIAATLGLVIDNSISGNIIDNADKGMYLYTVENTTISNNKITNSNNGILFEDGNLNNRITNNHIYGNSDYGIRNTTGVNVNATDNWWGDASGPSTNFNDYIDYVLDPISLKPADGFGDAVSENVIFDPYWINEEMTESSEVPPPSGGSGGIKIPSFTIPAIPMPPLPAADPVAEPVTPPAVTPEAVVPFIVIVPEPLFTVEFVTEGSLADLAEAWEAYEAARQAFETNRDSITAEQTALHELDQAVALAAILTLELVLETEEADLDAAVEAYLAAMELLEEHSSLLSEEQLETVTAVLETVAVQLASFGAVL